MKACGHVSLVSMCPNPQTAHMSKPPSTLNFNYPYNFGRLLKIHQCLLHSMGEKIFAALQDKTLAQQQRAVNQNGVLPSHISHKLMWTVECFWYELTAKLLALQQLYGVYISIKYFWIIGKHREELESYIDIVFIYGWE